jgi:hypothetical protein
MDQKWALHFFPYFVDICISIQALIALYGRRPFLIFRRCCVIAFDVLII